MLKQSDARKALLERVARQFHEALDDQTWAYLEGRGISEEQAETYLLGVVSNPDPLFAPFEGRLSLPFLTPTGVVSIRYRCIEDHDCKAHEAEVGFHKKYMQGKGEGDRLYNVAALHERHPAIAIVEGEIDTQFVDTHVLPAVGVTGATKWKPHYERLFLDYEKVFLIGDGDKAGREFVDKLSERLPNSQGVVLPKDHDVNSLYLESGTDALTEVILGKQ